MFEYALTVGLTASGADVYLLHMITTSNVSYVARTGGSDCGITISASHNPYYSSGIKLINTQGERVDEDMVLQIEAYLNGISGEIPLVIRERIGRIVDHAVSRNRYTGYLTSLVTRSYKNMKVGLDCVNGSAWMIARSVSNALGASTYVISNEPDGLNINTSCGFTYMEGLIRFVKEKKLDMGSAFGGDVDKCLCMDERGNLVDGDLVLYIYNRYMKERGKLAENKITATAMSNFGLYKALGGTGIECEETTVKDKYMYENVALNGYRIGSEQSGHIILRKYAATGSGILTAIRVMEMILEKKQPLSRLAEPIHIYPQVLENTRVEDKQTAREDWDAQDTVNRVEQELGTEERILARGNSTEPVMCVMVEARDGYRCREYMDRIIRVAMDEDHRDILS